MTRRRALLATVAVVAAIGCGASPHGAPPGVVETHDAAAAFAPLVLLDEHERRFPMSVDWFLDRAVLWYADRRCGDRKVAVGDRQGAQRRGPVDWIYLVGIGSGPAYYRSVEGPGCEGPFGVKVFANQHSRPFGVGNGRPAGLPRGDGFYLDLVDAARGGQRPDGRPGARSVAESVPAYVERDAVRVGGGPAIRLTYWLLFGMSDPPGSPARRHEGDWERVSILLTRHGERGYEPRSVAFGVSRRRTVAWSDVLLERDGDSVHPVLVARTGSHALRAARATCQSCVAWRTWRALEPLRTQPWYGFGGAWGEPGSSDATTGPLGPHGRWARNGGRRSLPENWRELR